MCTGVDLWDVITSVKFRFEDFSDFDGMGVKIRPLPLTLHVGLNHSAAHVYRAACEQWTIPVSMWNAVRVVAPSGEYEYQSVLIIIWR